MARTSHARGRNRDEAWPERAVGSQLYDSAKATFPILHVYEELDPFMAPDFSLLRSLARADRWIVSAAHLHHVHFTEIGAAVGRFPSLARATGADRDTPHSYEDVARTTVAFLDAVFDDRAHTAARIDEALARGGKNLTLVARLPAANRAER